MISSRTGSRVLHAIPWVNSVFLTNTFNLKSGPDHSARFLSAIFALS